MTILTFCNFSLTHIFVVLNETDSLCWKAVCGLISLDKRMDLSAHWKKKNPLSSFKIVFEWLWSTNSPMRFQGRASLSKTASMVTFWWIQTNFEKVSLALLGFVHGTWSNKRQIRCLLDRWRNGAKVQPLPNQWRLWIRRRASPIRPRVSSMFIRASDPERTWTQSWECHSS